MVKTQMKIIDTAGLHARPASLITAEASKYKSNIELEFGDKKANIKSIMNLMALGIPVNSVITIKCEGEDEELAIDNLVKLMKTNNFAK